MISFKQKVQLTRSLSWREIVGRYKGSALGLFWSMLTPVFMLGIYTFVFGTVFKSRWASSSADASPLEFAVILFIGLILFQIMSDTVGRAPGLIIGNTNYVKKVVFPLEILVPVAMGTALFHGFVSLLILLPFIYFVFGAIHWTIILLPFVIAPFTLLVMGASWFLASLGTFARDIGQVIGTILTAMLFLAPIFFPLEALPEWIRPVVVLNPLSLPVEQAREVLIFGNLPNWSALGVYSLIAIAICVLGFIWFQKTRKGFADVL